MRLVLVNAILDFFPKPLEGDKHRISANQAAVLVTLTKEQGRVDADE